MTAGDSSLASNSSLGDAGARTIQEIEDRLDNPEWATQRIEKLEGLLRRAATHVRHDEQLLEEIRREVSRNRLPE